MQEEELRGCPFCGLGNSLLLEEVLDKEYWQVKCTHCCSSGPIRSLKKDALDSWNWRYPNVD